MSDPSLALLLAAQGVDLDDSPATRHGLLSAISDTSMIVEITDRYGDRPWAAATDDSRHLAVSDGATARVWDAETKEACGPVLRGIDGEIIGLWFVPGENVLVALSSTGAVRWDWQTGDIVSHSSKSTGMDIGDVASFAMSPTGGLLAFGTRHSQIDLIDTTTWKVVATRSLYPPADGEESVGPADWVTDLVWQRDGTLAFLLSSDRDIKRWDTARNVLLPDLPTGLGQQPWSLQLSPDETLLAVGTMGQEGPVGSNEVPSVVALLDWPTGVVVSGPFGEHFSTVQRPDLESGRFDTDLDRGRQPSRDSRRKHRPATWRSERRTRDDRSGRPALHR